jgi:hypothetical protein
MTNIISQTSSLDTAAILTASMIGSTGSAEGNATVLGTAADVAVARGTANGAATISGGLRASAALSGQSSGHATVVAATQFIDGEELTINATLARPAPSFTGFAAPPGYLSPLAVPQKGLRVEAFFIEQVVNVVYAD